MPTQLSTFVEERCSGTYTLDKHDFKLNECKVGVAFFFRPGGFHCYFSTVQKF